MPSAERPEPPEQVALSLPGVPDAESFRHAILNARNAWAPEKAKGAFVPASASK